MKNYSISILLFMLSFHISVAYRSLNHQNNFLRFQQHEKPKSISSFDKEGFKWGRLLSNIEKPIRYLGKAKQYFDTKLPLLNLLWPRDSAILKLFLIASMLFMFLGKWINVQVPFILQRAIDILSRSTGSNTMSASILSASAALGLYGVSRAFSVVCSEIKTCLFAYVSNNVLRKYANRIFQHLHGLDSEFHLTTPSGVISVAYVRAVRAFQTMMFQLVFAVAPTLLELGLVSNILYSRCGPIFAAITLATFSFYLVFTVVVTEWRVAIRQELVDVDNARNGYFIDSILNHEVVKLFTNENIEASRFDRYLSRIQDLSISTTLAIAALNFGQAVIFCIGLTSSLLVSLQQVKSGLMSVGDVVAVNSMLLQLSIPFNSMGYTCTSSRQSRFISRDYQRTSRLNALLLIFSARTCAYFLPALTSDFTYPLTVLPSFVCLCAFRPRAAAVDGGHELHAECTHKC